MLETSLYSRVKPHLDKWGSHSRVENTVEPGMWDIHYCFNGMFGWIETKVEHQGKLYFEKFQLPWGQRYQRAGALKLFVLASLAGEKSPMALYHSSTVLKATRTPERKWITVRTSDLDPLLVMTKKYDWDALRLYLT